MTDRKATDAELRALANGEGLAPNSTFDGVNYRVTTQSSGAKTTTSSKKKSTAKSGGVGSSTQASASTTTTGGVTTGSNANGTDAQAARGPQ